MNFSKKIVVKERLRFQNTHKARLYEFCTGFRFLLDLFGKSIVYRTSFFRVIQLINNAKAKFGNSYINANGVIIRKALSTTVTIVGQIFYGNGVKNYHQASD